MSKLFYAPGVALLPFLVACGDAPVAEAAPPSPYETAAVPTAPGLVHQVYFWLQPGLSAAEEEAFVAGMRSLAEAPTVLEVEVGTAAATPEREVTDNSFDYFLTLGFENVAGHDAYQVSAVHEAFVAAHEAKFREVRVFDGAVVR